MTRPDRPIRLYRHPLSGHSHRAELFLSLLQLPFERVDVDIFKGEQKRPGFLALNLFAQVPVIEDGDATIADSNAILTYLALRYDAGGRWLPRDPLQAAQVQRWLSIAAGPLHNGPAAARVNQLFRDTRDARCGVIAGQLFERIETHLAERAYLVGDGPTIADIANYSYIAHAPEGGVSLADYPAVRAWLARVEGLPGFVPMPRSAVGLCA